MSRFRLFSRAAAPPPYPAPAHPPPVGPPRPLPPRPAAPAPVRPPAPPSVFDPPTDPHGFAPVPLRAAPLRAAELPDAAEAGALAGAFAADYLSWDEDDPERRGRVLAEYLPDPGSDPAHLGWTGTGRQRADFALPGLVRPDGEGRVLVDVRVRVTPYRVVGDHGAEPDGPEPDVAGVPAAAPAPTSRGWRSLPGYWIRISVPVALEGGRLVVDAWEETLGEDPPPPPPAVSSDDHALADDDPLDGPLARSLDDPADRSLGRPLDGSLDGTVAHSLDGPVMRPAAVARPSDGPVVRPAAVARPSDGPVVRPAAATAPPAGSGW